MRRYLPCLLLSLSGAVWLAGSGCVGGDDNGPPPARAVPLIDPMSDAPSYPRVNLMVGAATPLHFWDDPDETRHSRFRLRGIQVLQGPDDVMQRAPFRAGGLYPFLAWQEDGNQRILLAPGYNPGG